MGIHEKIKILRQRENWTQEEIADKLNWSLNSYAKVERGEVSITVSRLQQFIELMGINISELIDTNDNTTFNFSENYDKSNSNFQCNILSETQCAHDLEKSQLLLKEKNKEIEYLKREVEYLKKISDLKGEI